MTQSKEELEAEIAEIRARRMAKRARNDKAVADALKAVDSAIQKVDEIEEQLRDDAD